MDKTLKYACLENVLSMHKMAKYELVIEVGLIYLGFEKSQRSVTHDSLRYINIFTYLLT